MYGTWISLMPAICWKSSLATREDELPPPNVSVPGWRFASAMNSFTVFAGTRGFTSMTCPPRAMAVTGVKSRTGSYGIFL